MSSPGIGKSRSFAEIITAVAEDDEAHGIPVARSQWAPPDCTCPWPWPLGETSEHIRTTCPHYASQPRGG